VDREDGERTSKPLQSKSSVGAYLADGLDASSSDGAFGGAVTAALTDASSSDGAVGGAAVGVVVVAFGAGGSLFSRGASAPSGASASLSLSTDHDFLLSRPSSTAQLRTINLLSEKPSESSGPPELEPRAALGCEGGRGVSATAGASDKSTAGFSVAGALPRLSDIPRFAFDILAKRSAELNARTSPLNERAWWVALSGAAAGGGPALVKAEEPLALGAGAGVLTDWFGLESEARMSAEEKAFTSPL